MRSVGIRNEQLFFEGMIESITGDVIEIGSRDHGGEGKAVNFRDLCAEAKSFTGVDIEPGDGVDVVWDFEEGPGGFVYNHFDLVICCSVFEHVRKPWVLAQNIADIIKPGGAIFVSVPWVWKYHAYPDDYWRMSFSGVASLFPGFDFVRTAYATPIHGEIVAANQGNAKKIENNLAMYSKQISIERQAIVNRKYLPYLMTLMIGVKRNDQNVQAQK